MRRAFTTREKVLLVILAVIVLALGYWKLILEPINTRVEQAQAAMAAEQDEIIVNTIRVSEKKRMEAELEEIFSSGEAKPLPDYDNSAMLLVELHTVLASAKDYSLSFGTLTALEGDYIVERPVSLTFTTQTYEQARAILDALRGGASVSAMTDVSINLDGGEEAPVQVSASLLYFELKK